MALLYRQAPTRLLPGRKTTSQDYNKLAAAVNDRLWQGVGDPSWRIFWYMHSLVRNMRNRYTDEDFPDEDEWWKLWSHVPGKYAEEKLIVWPHQDIGEEGGLAVTNPLVGWIFGRIIDFSPFPQGLQSEADRMNTIPLSFPAISYTQPSLQAFMNLFPLYFYPRWVDPLNEISDNDSEDVYGVRWGDSFGADPFDFITIHAPLTPAEEWLMGIYQRGAMDPEMGIDAAAYLAPRQFYGFSDSLRSPYLKSYSTYRPIPPFAKSCYIGPSTPPELVYNLKFTNMNDGTIIEYPGKCPGENGYVAGVFEYDDAFYIYVERNNEYVLDRILPFSVWIEGPYNAGAILEKRRGEQMDQLLNHFAINFRGSLSERFSGSCYDIRRTGFNFEKFLNTQYLLAPAYGKGFFVDGELGPILKVREVYPRWSLANNTEDPITFPSAKIFSCLYISAVTFSAGEETDHYTDTDDTPKSIFPGCAVTGMYVYGENLTAPINVQLICSNLPQPIPITITPDGNGKVNYIRYLNQGELPVTGTYHFIVTPGTVLPPDAYINIDVLEQVIVKPKIADIYAILRMATCKRLISFDDFDTFAADVASPNVIFDVYYNRGYIANVNSSGVMDTYMGPFISPTAMYEEMRNWIHSMARMVDRTSLTGYEVSGGKSILYFTRYAWPPDVLNEIPEEILRGIAVLLPRGELELSVAEEGDLLEDNKEYILSKVGTVIPNPIYPTPESSMTVYDKVAYGNAVNNVNIYDVHSPGTVGYAAADGLLIGNNDLLLPGTPLNPIFELVMDDVTFTEEDYPLIIAFAASFGILTDQSINGTTLGNGFSWKIERRQLGAKTNPSDENSRPVITDWETIADGGGYFFSGQGIYHENEAFTITVKKVQYRFTGRPILTRTSSNVKVHKKIQSGIEVGKTYEVRGRNTRIFTPQGQAVDVDAKVIYPAGSTDVEDEYHVGETIIGGKHKDLSDIVTDPTKYELTTGRERVVKLILDGIINGHTYLVRGEGHVIYPAGTSNFYGEEEASDTFVGGSNPNYSISDPDVRVYDITDGHITEEVRTAFDVFDGIAPDRNAASFTGIRAGVVYKVKGTTGGITYNGNNYSNGQTFTGVTNVNTYVANPLESDGRAYALTGGVWSVAPKKGMSNEWQMFMNSHAYHPSDTSLWHPNYFGDILGFLNNRCHLYSPDLQKKIHENLLMQFSYGIKPVVRSESPPGYNYLQQTHNAANAPWFVDCEEFGIDEGNENNGPCAEKTKEAIRDFYRSCRIYPKDYEVESVELTDIDGEVKVTFKTRFHHHHSAPSSIPKESRLGGTIPDNTALRQESYRTDENAIREYIRYLASNPREQFPNATSQHCTRYKRGDYAPGSILPFLPDNPFGACYPRFYFLKKIPYVAAEVGEPTTEAGIGELDHDTRREVDAWGQMEFYMRAMCGGFLDKEGTRRMSCTMTSGTSRMIDFTFENLISQATQRAEGTMITPPTLVVTPVYELDARFEGGEITQMGSDNIENHISWTSTPGTTDYKVFRRILQLRVDDPETEEIENADDPETEHDESQELIWSEWEEIAQVAHPDTTYTDTYNTSVQRFITAHAMEFKVERDSTGIEVPSEFEQIHNVVWGLADTHLYEVWRRENTSYQLDEPAWTEWHRIPAAQGNFNYPAQVDEFNVGEEGYTQIQYKIRMIKGFLLTFPYVPGRSYIPMRQITRQFDSDEDFVEIDIVTATNNPEAYFDRPNFRHVTLMDVMDETVQFGEELTAEEESITITPINVSSFTVTPEENYRHTLDWTGNGGGHTWHILRRVKNGDAWTRWTRLSTSSSETFADIDALHPDVYSDIEYRVQRINQTLPTVTYTGNAGNHYRIVRTTVTINGDTASQPVPQEIIPDGWLWFDTTDTFVFNDADNFITPILASVTYKVYRQTGYTITWNRFNSSNPGMTYNITRHVIGQPSVVIDTYTQAEAIAANFTHTDNYIAPDQGGVATYTVIISFDNHILDVDYQVLALSVNRNRSIPFMPLSKRSDRPEGFGPLPNTCMHANTYNIYAEAINLLTQARIDLPFDFECQNSGGDTSYIVDPDCSSNNVGVPKGETYGNCAFNEDGSCSNLGNSFTHSANSNLINNLNTNVLVFGVPISYGPEIVQPWTICGGSISAGRAGGLSNTHFACDGQCQRVIAAGTSWSKAKLRIRPNAFAQYAMDPDLRAIARSQGFGFYGIESTSEHATKIVEVESMDDACRTTISSGDGGNDANFWMWCDHVFWAGTESLGGGNGIQTSECKFYSGTAEIIGPPLSSFDDGFHSVTGVAIGGTRVHGCGGASTDISISIPDLTQFVSLVTVPTKKQ